MRTRSIWNSPPFIRAEDFRTTLDFAVASGQRVIGILGGEPSTHPQLLDLLRMAWDAGIATKVFTNGLWRRADREAIARLAPEHERLLSLIVNLNHPDDTPPGEQRGQAAFLEATGKHCVLSHNLFRIDTDPAFLVDRVLRHRTRREIRLGIAQPTVGLETTVLDVSQYPKLAPAVIRLVRLCDEHDIRVGFDCGFTLCMFTPEELGVLQLAGARFRSHCGPAIDIGTDLGVFPCFPLSKLVGDERLDAFTDVRQVTDHFRNQFARLYRTGVLEQCRDCHHLRRGRCSGGCAAHVHREFQPC